MLKNLKEVLKKFDELHNNISDEEFLRPFIEMGMVKFSTKAKTEDIEVNVEKVVYYDFCENENCCEEEVLAQCA